MRRIVNSLSFMALIALAMAGVPAAAEDDDAPDGVQILLPRGGIPAVFDPEFVPAGEATIANDAWIMGVVVNGEARAYSLNLLNSHEIVNDNVGGVPLAAVW